MSRRFRPSLYLLVFFPIGLALCAELWPIVMHRPVPDELGGGVLRIALAGLLLSGIVTVLLTTSIQRGSIHR